MEKEGMPIANYIMFWVIIMTGIVLGSIAMSEIGEVYPSVAYLPVAFFPTILFCSVAALCLKNRLVEK